MQKRKVFVLLLLGMLICQASVLASLNVYFSGNLKGQILHTPQEGWQALKLFNANVWAKGEGTPVSAVIRFADVGDDFSWQSITGAMPPINTQIVRATLISNAPVFADGMPAVLSAGDISVNYSPLVARIDDSVKVDGIIFNPMKKGLSLEKLSVPFGNLDLTVNGFAVWEQNSESERMPRAIGVGTKFAMAVFGNDLDVTFVQRKDEKNPNKIQSQNNKGEAALLHSNQTYLVELVRRYSLGKIEFSYGNNLNEVTSFGSTTDTVSTSAPFKQFAVEYALLPSVNSRFEYIYLDPDFEPVYRDRTPRFNEEGMFIGWNPLDSLRYIEGLQGVDQYFQNQYRYALNFREGGIALAIEGDYRQLQSSDRKNYGYLQGYRLKSQAQWQNYSLDGELRHQTLIMRKHALYTREVGRRAKLEIKRPIYESAFVKGTLGYRIYYEGLYPELFNLRNRLRMENVVAQGVLKGMKFYYGLESYRPLAFSSKEPKVDFQFGVAHETDSGLFLEFAWSSSNDETKPIYGPEGLEYWGYDNIFRFGLSMPF